jgi:diguanylate cyclase (GGDEF)-like protein
MKNIWIFHLVLMLIAIFLVVVITISIDKTYSRTFEDLKILATEKASQKILSSSLSCESNLINYIEKGGTDFLNIFKEGVIYNGKNYSGKNENIVIAKNITRKFGLYRNKNKNEFTTYLYKNNNLYSICVYSNGKNIYFLIDSSEKIIRPINSENKSIKLFITDLPIHEDAMEIAQVDGKKIYIDYDKKGRFNTYDIASYAAIVFVAFFILAIIITFIGQKKRIELRKLLLQEPYTKKEKMKKIKTSIFSGSLYEMYETLKELTSELKNKNQELENVNEITERKKEIIEKLFVTEPEKYFNLSYPAFFDEMLKFILKILLHGERGSVVMADKENKGYKFIAMKGYNINTYRNIVLKKDQLFINFESASNNPVVVKNPTMTTNGEDPVQIQLNSYGKLWTLKETLAAPVKIGEKIMAIIYIDIFNEDSHFTKGDIELMQYFVAYIGTFLRNKMYYDKIMELSNTDELTKIHNRRYFEKIVSNEILRAQRYKYKDGILYFDLNDFKEINDTYGHKIGDEALKTFTQYIKKHLRNSDTFARFGGDEFIALLPFVEKNELVKKIEQLRSNPIYIESKNKKIRIEYAVGYAIIPDDGVTVDEILIKADMQMYDDKLRLKQGKKDLS